jgi:hypothetical protein
VPRNDDLEVPGGDDEPRRAAVVEARRRPIRQADPARAGLQRIAAGAEGA